MRDIPTPDDESENLSSRRIDRRQSLDDIAPLPPRGNYKEIHNHNGNGTSQKIVWAWAGTATALFVAAMWAYLSADDKREVAQTETNRSVATALTTQAVAIGRLETKVETLQRSVDNVERKVEQQR